MNTSLLPPRHNRPCHAATSASLRRWIGARVCNPQQRSSAPGTRPPLTTHSVAADCKSALLAAVALPAALAWGATPLAAEVIDDFSGPRRFVVFGAGGSVPDYTCDGELRCTITPPEIFETFWYYSRLYELPEAQPVEFRVDVTALSNSDAAAGLTVAFPSPPTIPRGSARMYSVWWLPERVGLDKGYDITKSRFFDTSHAPWYQPATLSLTLTRQGPNLQVGVRAVERDDPQHVLFSRTVTDRAGADVADDNGPPPAGPVAGVGLYAINNGVTATVEVSLDNLACSAEARPMTLGIRGNTGRESSLHWSHTGVLFEAESIGGTWKPWAGTVQEAAGAYLATIPGGGGTRFYQLATGELLLDLFDWQWEMLPRSTCSPVPAQTSVPALAITIGQQGRIQGTGTRNADFLLHYMAGLGGFCFPPERDVCASVDIVDWDETMEDAAFGIVLRARPEKGFWLPTVDGLPHDRYAGMLTFKKASSPSESVLSLTGPGGEPLEVKRFPAVDPARQYRLRFWAVGSQLTLELFRLDNLAQPVETCAATDGRVAEGMDAMYGLKSSVETYDVTIDRYQVTGTRR